MTDSADRTSLEYFESALERVWADDNNTPILGLSVGRPPDTYDELASMVEASRNRECGASDEIDAFMELIASLSDRDEVVRQLPCHEKKIAFILPRFDRK